MAETKPYLLAKYEMYTTNTLIQCIIDPSFSEMQRLHSWVMVISLS